MKKITGYRRQINRWVSAQEKPCQKPLPEPAPLPILRAEQKYQELQRAIEIIREEIDLDMLILFGSYARGDWVEDLDPQTLLYCYQSDFDLLVITETPRQAGKIEQNNQLAQRLAKTIHRTPISLIAEDIQFVNRRFTIACWLSLTSRGADV